MAVKEAVVKHIDKNYVVVSPVISETCITCTQRCLLRGKRLFRAKNKKNLALKRGSLVVVGTARRLEAFLGVVSLIIPILCAFLGFFLTKDKSENCRAVCVLLLLLASTLILFIINRTLYRWYKPEIIEVL